MPRLTPGLIRTLIRDNLRREWAETDPGPDCFDASEANMDRLLRLIRGGDSPAESRAAREHLMACPRCRYIYARTREAELAADR